MMMNLAPSAASAERNWSTQDYIISKRRNSLAPQRAEKLVNIYFNLRSLRKAQAQKCGPGITEEALLRWHASLVVHPTFRWPTESEGRHTFEWDDDSDDADTEFVGMHGDEMDGGITDSSEDEMEEGGSGGALVPFEPDDFSTPGEGLTVLPCPTKLPHDLEVGGKLACWFAYPYNSWFVGKILEVNKRRTKSENVLVQFINPDEGETEGLLVAEQETYGVDKLWVVLKTVPIDVDAESDSSSPPSSSDA